MALSDELSRLFADGARPRCYIASPLGFSEATRGYYRDVYLPALARRVEVVDPWALTSKEEVAQAETESRLRALWLAQRTGDRRL